MKILLAGDGFVLNDLLERELLAVPSIQYELTRIVLPWPAIPFGPVAEVEEASGSEEEVIRALRDAEVIITQMAPLTARVLAAAIALKLVICARGGPVNVNVRAANERGIAVCPTPGRNAVAVAEYTLLLMLAALRRLPEAHTSLVGGEWRSGLYAYGESGGEIADSVVGVVGLGEIGRRVAASVRAMGALVIAHDPYATSSDGVELVPLDELLERADIVTLHARLTQETRHMIGAAEITRMRPGAILVNTARGGLLDYDAAVSALASGRLRALALDVFPEEPVPATSSLLRARGVVLSPHLAGATQQTAARAAAYAARELDRYARGEPLMHVMNGIQPGPRR
ncbi:MAG TPA: NAD(P)-dependent oxidoreductase [Candidatus Limnocylindria bacterium]|nr:NAD(P)-dependent oxidoreductase [Candidatus Limnocylindria bacterium]